MNARLLSLWLLSISLLILTACDGTAVPIERTESTVEELEPFNEPESLLEYERISCF